ncbi:HupE/UreJ family protein [Flavobacterium restrictum]|uniref:HupE/UreJ family protein n=1 Tax=Flavobacterium restrictum TaxID=2594428 RepID=A0A553DRI7_9FLAO|nr:HupE/UreJ family protein [Flavobacterium restrictum]TRX35401.1 HupE/UreJ family protein [Flavobacterium restrictum]
MNKLLFTLLFLFTSFGVFAHPMPNTTVSLSVMENSVVGEAKMSLSDLEAAMKIALDENHTVNTPFFKDYFRQHIKAYSGKNVWETSIDSIYATTEFDTNVGKYREVIVWFKMVPPQKKSVRNFVFNYDAIIHQVVTHSILVFLKNDWKNGIRSEDGGIPLGTIYTNFQIGAGKYEPLEVNLEDGSYWTGFKGIFALGMEHIKEGTDHLLFLLVLLLPAPLVVNKKKWGRFGGIKYSVIKLLKVITAFTIGHSITLLIGALGWFHLPTQPVEILIAVSILVSAVHAIRPVFAGKEMYVAAGFGLVHGLAFATVLSNLNLDTSTMVLSILGFNIGIEVMQLFVIAITIPWFVIMSKTNYFVAIKNGFAILVAFIAVGWIVQRITGNNNFITIAAEKLFGPIPWLILGLSILSITLYVYTKFKKFEVIK